ncbi:hypothetical protein JWG42_03970 [Desulfoprunum benzoelyticum]|uniref:Uncharacterized protein n=1 Tax=Desulfoprunum benzoelyticum TaxID=1506996 RepID=A0A840UPZ5_9BACT|nr:hypothetical protein [Desulfoprunum benzoelyticum]MBB5347715.1 hypothetical protein [Desulfoprunum benzoelyticum]MBM9529308.1 hypothetical protein [Desulfoprunum benzoelyticum]
MGKSSRWAAEFRKKMKRLGKKRKKAGLLPTASAIVILFVKIATLFNDEY